MQPGHRRGNLMEIFSYNFLLFPIFPKNQQAICHSQESDKFKDKITTEIPLSRNFSNILQINILWARSAPQKGWIQNRISGFCKNTLVYTSWYFCFSLSSSTGISKHLSLIWDCIHSEYFSEDVCCARLKELFLPDKYRDYSYNPVSEKSWFCSTFLDYCNPAISRNLCLLPIQQDFSTFR